MTMGKEIAPLSYAVIGRDGLIDHMMNRLGYMKATETSADIVIWTGGEDVNPQLYGHQRHYKTHFSYERDIIDGKVWEMLKKFPNIIKVGICRGAQFLCTRNNGVLWQDVSNHTCGSHMMKFLVVGGTTTEINVTSTHHQMMRPIGIEGTDYNRWGWCERSTHRDYGWEKERKSDFKSDGPDNEIIWYPKTRTLCFQPHPEYSHAISTRNTFEVCLERALATLKG